MTHRIEEVELATETVDPLKALINRFRDEVIPRIEQQQNPFQRRAMLARLEEDLRDAFKVLNDLDNDLQETRRKVAQLFKAARKLRPRGKPRPQSRKRKLALRRPRLIPTDEQKEVVLGALRTRDSMAMSDLCHATGYGMAKLKRILKVLRDDGRVDRSGVTSGTRYRARGKEGNG
jgi:chromatin segregation and condensation protein Rec8/ScpA/Scc1 (kleisin family)